MIKEFREFLFRGNIVDLAVAVVIGTAFGTVVNSLVADVLTPLLGIFGVPDFSTWVIQIGDAQMMLGVFLNSLISFAMVAAAIFFVVVKPMQRIDAALTKKTAEEEAGPTEVELLTEIRDALRKSA